jgi:hypothetical protein
MGSGAEKKSENPWLRFGSLLVFALLFTAIVANRSLELSSQHGRLSVPPTYDDVVYFLDAARWLNAAPGQSVTAGIWGLLRQHAPFSTLVAAIGLSLFPDGYVGPYLVHAVIVFAFLVGIIWLTWKRPVSEVATCLIAAASVPVLWHTVTEARPDLPSGLALGIAAGAVVRGGVLQRSSWHLAALGAGCGLAASIKPTSFPASLPFLGTLFAIRLFFDCLQSGGLRTSVGRASAALLWFAVGLIATPAVLIGPTLIETIHYILNASVTQRDFWSGGEGFWPGLLRFSVGNEGTGALDFWLWVGLALMLTRLLLAAANGRAAVHEATAVLAAVVLAYTIPSVVEIKTYFFGAIFYGVFVVAMTMNYCASQASIESLFLRSQLGDAAKRYLLIGVRVLPLAVAALLFLKSVVINQVSLATFFTAQQREDIRAGTERVWSLLRDAKSDPSSTAKVSFSSPYPVTPSVIVLYAAQAQKRLIVGGEFFERTVDATENALLQSNIIVLSSSIPHNLPGPRMGDELIARFDANKDVCLLDSLTFPDVQLRIYRRLDAIQLPNRCDAN